MMAIRAQNGDSRDRIFSAADELFGARGYAGTSVRDIAERAGVNKALVFYHYNSKGELFEAVVDRYYRAHLDALAGALTDNGDAGSPHARLHRVLDAYLDFIEENRRYVQLIQREIAMESEALERIREGLTRVHDWMAETFDGILPRTGAQSSRQLFVSFSGLVTTYYMYAPVLAEIWGSDPNSVANHRERREHLHWLVDTILDQLFTNPS